MRISLGANIGDRSSKEQVEKGNSQYKCKKRSNVRKLTFSFVLPIRPALLFFVLPCLTIFQFCDDCCLGIPVDRVFGRSSIFPSIPNVLGCCPPREIFVGSECSAWCGIEGRTILLSREFAHFLFFRGLTYSKMTVRISFIIQSDRFGWKYPTTDTGYPTRKGVYSKAWKQVVENLLV